MSDIFTERRRALEDQYFQKQNDALVRRMKEAAAHTATREQIHKLTGITQEQVLESLAAMNLGAAATLVMSLYPLVDVAWADGQVTERERQVVMEQAHAMGIAPGTDAAAYLAQWLDERPAPSWATLWLSFVHELAARLSADDRALLKAELLGRARHVAEASGGILGRGWTLNSAEKAALHRLEQAFA